MTYKSKGEEAIAEVLKRYNIHFEYEYPILIKEKRDGDTDKMRIWYPDFWLPEYSIIIEYFGMDNKSYKDGVDHKKKVYKQLCFDLIPVYPSTIRGKLKDYLLIQISKLINDKRRLFDNRNK